VTNKHCSDNEIQAFVLQKNDCSAAIQEHIALCTDCAAKAQQYMLLVEAIEAQPQPVFNFDLAAAVMHKLPAPKPKTAGEKFLIYPAIISCILIAGIIVFVFRNIFISMFNAVNTMLYALVFTTVASLFVFLCTDMYRKYKAQMRALNLN
jgi:hypothetical protein